MWKFKKYYLNNDKDKVSKIVKGVLENDGHCPCQIEKSEASICKPVKEGILFKEIDRVKMCANAVKDEKCHCGLYLGKEIKDNVAYVKRENPEEVLFSSYKYKTLYDFKSETSFDKQLKDKVVVIGMARDIK